MPLFNPFVLDNKRIIITGASSGIGRQCAIDCSKMGANIIATGRNKERLEDTIHSLDGDGHLLFDLNLEDLNQIPKKIEEIVKQTGKIDGFIHAAGLQKTLPLKFTKVSDLEEIMNINLYSGIEIIKSLSLPKNHNKGFKAVFISSITSVIARPGTLAYTASKGAIVSVVRELAIELASKKININCISPGTVLTPLMDEFLQTLSDEERENRLSGFPLGIGQPSDISYACIYLLSEASRWITGQNIVIDGGYTIK